MWRTIALLGSCRSLILPAIRWQRSKSVSYPVGVAVSPNGARVYVTNPESDEVSVINTATNAVTTIAVGPEPTGVAVTPSGSYVFVSNFDGSGSLDEGTLSVIDTSSNALVSVLPSGGQRPAGLVATASHVYVAHFQSDAVSVIDI
jgi:YVTN family beta-propeller protein